MLPGEISQKTKNHNMAREVLTLNDIQRSNKSGSATGPQVEASSPTGADTYVDRLFKYIPAELVAGYIFVMGVVKRLTDTGEIRIIHWLLFILFCILTPFYLWRVQKVLKVQQHFISLLSFVVWVFALGGPFTLFGWYNPLYGEILLPVFTLIVAIWEAE
jgi:hypothetical protein